MYSTLISSRNARRLEKKATKARVHAATINQKIEISPRSLALYLSL